MHRKVHARPLEASNAMSNREFGIGSAHRAAEVQLPRWRLAATSAGASKARRHRLDERRRHGEIAAPLRVRPGRPDDRGSGEEGRVVEGSYRSKHLDVIARRASLAAVLLGAALALNRCAAGEGTLAAVDPEAAPLHPTYEQVFGIVEFACAPCHDETGGSEPGEDDLDFSTCEGIQRGLEGIRTTALHGGSMPPGAWPRLTEREKLLIERWIDQGACSPCTSPCP
jgi:hypothetical protein